MTGLQNQLASFTGTYVPSTLAPPSDGDSAKIWQHVIDAQLIEWGRYPEQFGEEGLRPPTARALAMACDLARYCRDRQTLPPLRAAPDGSGGIMFEWRIGPVFQTVEIDENGKIEMLSFENNKLVFRLPIG